MFEALCNFVLAATLGKLQRIAVNIAPESTKIASLLVYTCNFHGKLEHDKNCLCKWLCKGPFM